MTTHTHEIHVHAHSYNEIALMSDVDLVCDETSREQVEYIRNTLMRERSESDVEEWFRKVAQNPQAIRCMIHKRNGRLIAWKTGTKFNAENIFFHTIDTARLLPMALADARIQWYAHKDTWALIDRRGKETNGSRMDFQIHTLAGLIFPLLILRNMHDYGGADIPLIFTDWPSDFIDKAFDYWVDLSKGMSPAEREIRFHEVDNRLCHRLRPCFSQVDLLVRALLSDPAAEYVPRFIVFMSSVTNAKARALYTNPTFVLPEELSKSYPTGCGSKGCTDADCGFFDFSASRSLVANSKLVRKDDWPRGIARCNTWICKVEEPAKCSGRSKFKTCQRCAEVLYCCQEHQRIDWHTHKRVCEERPINV